MGKLKYILPASLLVLSSLVFYVTFVRAEDSPMPSASPSATETPNPSETPRFGFFGFGRGKNESPEPSESPRVKGLDRLEDRRLRFCEEHEEEIDNRLESLGDLTTRMLGVFDIIAKRVEDFYTDRVASTHPISNYAALVSDIAAKRAAAVTALTNAENDVKGFKCTGDNPKGQMIQFRLDMQMVKQALKDYRTSIKNLIVAVKSAIGEGQESPEPSEKPKATATPVLTPTPTPVVTATP